MCIVQYYTRWQCGCPIAAADQAMLKTCLQKVTNPKSNCVVYVLPVHGNGEAHDTSSKQAKESDRSEEESVERKQTAEPVGEAKHDENQGSVRSCPRQCVFHETKFELAARSYWKSEMLWLQPRLRRHGAAVRQAVAQAQTSAARLWALYHMWKFFHGGDRRGSVLVAQHAAAAGVLAEDGDTTISASTSCCCTVPDIVQLGSVDYQLLRSGLDDLLEPLRACLHPREMVE